MTAAITYSISLSQSEQIGTKSKDQSIIIQISVPNFRRLGNTRVDLNHSTFKSHPRTHHVEKSSYFSCAVSTISLVIPCKYCTKKRSVPDSIRIIRQISISTNGVSLQQESQRPSKYASKRVISRGQ